MKVSTITWFSAACFFWLNTFVVPLSEINDKCTDGNKDEGRCLLLRDCPKAQEALKKGQRTEFCGLFESLNEIIVCCEIEKPNNTDTHNTSEIPQKKQPGDISLQKCHEKYFNSPPQQEEVSVIIGAGGYNSPAKEYPHMAALGYDDEENETTWACGGSLISENFVLTAAHCIQTLAFGTVKLIRLGDLNLRKTDDNAKPQNFGIKRLIVHPQYKPVSVYHDIALIELNGSIIENIYVRPACLQVSKNVSNTTWTALGWGVTSYGGNVADHLQTVTLREFPHRECNRIFNRTTKRRRLKDGIVDEIQVCAADEKQDTCQGDSGGPLQTHTKFNRGYNIVGITSFGEPCAMGLIPSIYTRVSYYVPWIESIVWPEH